MENSHEKKGKFLKLQNKLHITLGDFFSNLAKSSGKKGKTREITESPISLCDLTSFFKWIKKSYI